MVNSLINKKHKLGKRLAQNQIKVQQLKNSQFILTLPQLWAGLLGIKKGSKVTFIPGKSGGVELLRVDDK